MKYSLDWIKQHIAHPLPDTNSVVREVTLRAFEVEAVEPAGEDMILEIKVLPDRAHDALSHRGMAREICSLFGLARRDDSPSPISADAAVSSVHVNITDPQLCMRYIAVRIDNVTIGSSPSILTSKLEAIGGRSINNIVDITNVVLFDIGQPLHAFDADKVKGGITVRLAQAGEQMTTLDNKALTLTGSELVIADDEAVLALAGIKGGKKAEVTSLTKNIILECANFDPTTTRKTSQKHNVKTDASKRYENGMTSSFAKEGCDRALALIARYGGDAVSIGNITDVYPVDEKLVAIPVTGAQVEKLLGLTLSDAMIREVLTKANFSFEVVSGVFQIIIPISRLDLRTKEEMIKEIGRLFGYDHILPLLPEISMKGKPNKRMFYANKVRALLVARGFSEVVTYSFAAKGYGNIEVQNPVGQDRPMMRADLGVGITNALITNMYYSPLIGITDVKIFEFGDVFKRDDANVVTEHLSFAIGMAMGSKAAAKGVLDAMKDVYSEISRTFSIVVPAMEPRNIVAESLRQGGMIWEFNFDALIDALPPPSAYEILGPEDKGIRYQILSTYPFVVRDIAVFVPESVIEKYIEELIKDKAGKLLVRFARFDKFQKPGDERISYGYRMVFQSFERTLTDEEVGGIMEDVTEACNSEANWQVR